MNKATTQDISKQIYFTCVIYGYPTPSKSKSLWENVKKGFKIVTTTSPTGTNMEQVSSGSTRIQSNSLPRNITTLEKRYIQDCLNTFYIRVKTLKTCFIIRNQTESGNPQADVLENACRMCIGCFNSYMNSLEGVYVDKYGVVKADELKVDNVEIFSRILHEAVNLGFLPKRIQAVSVNYLSIMDAKIGKTEVLPQTYKDIPVTTNLAVNEKSE